MIIMNNDLIERQAAIDAMCSVCGYDCDKSKFVYNAPQCEQVILCPEHYALSVLPSAQPEIIRCKDCKWKQGSECTRFSDVRPFPDDFCSRAERRTDECTD